MANGPWAIYPRFRSWYLNFMTTASDSLALQTRARIGTTGSRALRRLGKIPGTLYGHDSAPLAIAVDGRAFEDLLHTGGRHHLLTISVDGGRKDTALVREVQRDPITRRIVHCDLQRVGRSEAISTTLRLTTTGIPIGVKDFGGVLDVVVRELEVTGPADQIPDKLEIDVSHLGIREQLNAGDVPLPKGFTLETPAETIVITVEHARTAIEAEAPAEGGEVPTVAATEEAES
jgi:large subunit ribosomal protein L25